MALRDVFRAREAVRSDIMRARQRLSKLLLRHVVVYEDTASAWTIRHRSWLTSLDLGRARRTDPLHEYLGAIDAIVIRLSPMRWKTIAEPDTTGSPWQQTVARLQGTVGSTPCRQSACAPRSAVRTVSRRRRS